MIDETEAIAAACAFVTARNAAAWVDATIRVQRGSVAGRDVWIVVAQPPPPDWTEIDWPPVRYFVDVATGKIAGFATERSETLFTP